MGIEQAYDWLAPKLSIQEREALDIIYAELAALRAERDRLREFADDVRKWSEAYPTNIFTEPTPEQVDAVCKTLGFRLDRIAAMVLREFTKPWGDAARAALGREGESDGH